MSFGYSLGTAGKVEVSFENDQVWLYDESSVSAISLSWEDAAQIEIMLHYALSNREYLEGQAKEIDDARAALDERAKGFRLTP